jgi:UDP-2,4-diacetamido-2,4,6-trideoxy-beta-L-altropyranose hydrolase
MAELILNADLAIGAGGSSMWERCYLGLPTITVIFAKNQERATVDIAKKKIIEYLGWAHELDKTDYASSIVNLINNPQRVKQMSELSLNVINQSKISTVDLMKKLK